MVLFLLLLSCPQFIQHTDDWTDVRHAILSGIEEGHGKVEIRTGGQDRTI